MALAQLPDPVFDDGGRPTSQTWNAIAEQINERIVDNVGNIEIDIQRQAVGTAGRLGHLFSVLKSSPDFAFNHGLIDFPARISTILKLQLFHNYVGIFDWGETRRLQRQDWTKLADDLFYGTLPPYHSRGWASGDIDPTSNLPFDTEQVYQPHWNNTGTATEIPNARLVGEMLSAIIATANGHPDDKIGNYDIQAIAPDFERFLSEPQCRLANETHRIKIGAEEPRQAYQEFSIQTSKIYEIFGKGTFTIDVGLDTERNITITGEDTYDMIVGINELDGEPEIKRQRFGGYHWIPQGAASVWARDDAYGTIVSLETRPPNYRDACLLTYLFFCREGVEWLQVLDADDNEVESGADSPANRQRMEEYVADNPDTRIVETTTALKQHNGLFANYFNQSVGGIIPEANIEFIVEESPDLIRSPVQLAQQWIDKHYQGDIRVTGSRYKTSISTSRKRVFISENYDPDGDIEEWGDLLRQALEDKPIADWLFPSGRAFVRGKYVWDNLSQTHTPPTDDSAGVPPQIHIEFEDELPASFQPTYWLRLLPLVKEDDPPNIVLDPDDTRCFARLFNDAYCYLRCIATAFSLPAERINRDTNEAVDDDDCSGNVITIIRDITVERFANELGIENFGGKYDQFGVCPNSEYIRATMSSLNDAVNLLRHVRVAGLTFNLRITGTDYEYEGNIIESQPAGNTTVALKVIHDYLNRSGDDYDVPVVDAWWEPEGLTWESVDDGFITTNDLPFLAYGGTSTDIEPVEFTNWAGSPIGNDPARQFLSASAENILRYVGSEAEMKGYAFRHTSGGYTIVHNKPIWKHYCRAKVRNYEIEFNYDEIASRIPEKRRAFMMQWIRNNPNKIKITISSQGLSVCQIGNSHRLYVPAEDAMTIRMPKEPFPAVVNQASDNPQWHVLFSSSPAYPNGRIAWTPLNGSGDAYGTTLQGATQRVLLDDENWIAVFGVTGGGSDWGSQIVLGANGESIASSNPILTITPPTSLATIRGVFPKELSEIKNDVVGGKTDRISVEGRSDYRNGFIQMSVPLY